jgi:2-dehydro-3-deoxyglucarate aldolase/4-hydroxy-2-oxoheptanedioate aldolase
VTEIGFWLETENQKSCEMARVAGYDFVIFDMEHGIISDNALDRLVPYCNHLGFKTYVRVSEATQPRIQTALDIGAFGVILPQIHDLAHARAVTSFAKFPLLGARGLGYSRTQGYGAASNEFIAEENAKRLCFPMIETAGAFADVDAIAALPCVDGLFIGPSDLSLNRGRGVFSANEADIADMEKIADAARKVGKPWAAAAGNAAYRRQAVRAGAAFVTAADDLSALLAGFKALRG